ncbi:FRG domain-containing protein [Planktosalinus lacus]|uniref:FRG domain-containing protein n=1 Tax=Planktosalinus lacus TaxID=1526573 RepID=A0A8J2YBG2_9FLAO|nr:FRG domain-containing protein [Planktosalinus lacus]GGD99034.1 hypothetical protein GCM10011312_23140 [Planktosalinus lacus]
MNYYQISEHIQKKYLKPLESFEIKNLQDVRSFHDKMIKINVDLITKGGFPVMPHYRGEQNYGWDILPGIFREPFSKQIDLSKAREIEKNGAVIFKKKVIDHYGENQLFKHSKKPYGEDWDLIFQAQHAGVKTNLIDLTTSSVSSAFFMSEPSTKHENSDGQLWGLLVPHDFILNETSDYEKLLYPNFNPYDLDSSFVCNVPIYINDIDQRTYQFRLFRQHGRLFASSNSDIEVPLNKKDFWKNMIVRIRVKAEAKKLIFDELKANGIDKDRLVLTQSEEATKLIDEINNEMKNFS